jgi:phosphopantothenoylcysteine decarboxylase/phosphopantothenate--cysteine ligase
MAAAPADFRPSNIADHKIKKRADGTAPTIELTTNPDIAAELGAAKAPGQVLVAFAAETQNALEHAREKLVKKNADLIVVNDVGTGQVFGSDGNEATILGADGSRTAQPRQSKESLANAVWDRVIALL